MRSVVPAHRVSLCLMASAACAPEIARSPLVCAGGMAFYLHTRGAWAKAKELIFTAARISAEQALEIGLVNAVGGDAMAEAQCIVAGILGCGPLALRSAKNAIDAGFDADLDEGLRIEQSAYQAIIPTQDRLEALAAFAEKRPPRFEGR